MDSPSHDTWALVAGERRALLETLRALPETRWGEPTWCAGWAARDLVGHLTMATDTPLARALLGMARARFDVDRFLDASARDRGRAPVPDLVEGFSRSVDSRRGPPGARPEQLLVEVVSHAQDLRRPLHLPRPTPPQVLRVALTAAVTLSRPFGSAERAAGLHLVATDCDWTHGAVGAPEVRGTGDAVLLALLGRPEVVHELSGSGTVGLAR